jgi:hypothetical protein
VEENEKKCFLLFFIIKVKMSHVDITQNPHLLSHLYRAENDIDEILNPETESKPAVWERSSQTLPRIHLNKDDPRLPECKRQIREIKAAIKAQLIEDFGEATWEARMPFDAPIVPEYIPIKL